jgi:hypothetical protein
MLMQGVGIMKRFPRISEWLNLSRYLEALVASWDVPWATCRVPLPKMIAAFLQ